MRFIFTFLGIILFNVMCGQTLQFSQVLLVSSNTQTVPAGKVWKVENILASSSLVVNNSIKNFTITVDNTSIFVAGAVEYAGPSSANQLVQPIWLPAGSTLAAGQNVFRVSVIEFNVLP